MTEARFVGAIPELYDTQLGPVLFEPYANDLAARLPPGARRVLEVAAGTGRVTRHLLAALPADGELIATDLNPPMLEALAKRLHDPRLTRQQADAQALPFGDARFDAVVCQFGLMFVPDKARALGEMRRVLVAGGALRLSVWDALANNPASLLLHRLAFAEMPDNPPSFMSVPFSMPDATELAELVDDAGFRDVRIDTVKIAGESPSADDLALGFVRGNPLWNQLAERGLDGPAFQAKVAAALRAEYGDAPCRTPMSAHVLAATA